MTLPGRLGLATTVIALVAIAIALWRRPGRLIRTSTLDLADLGLRGPAVIQFSTPSCTRCRVARTVLEGVAGTAGIPFDQIDLHDRPDVAARYGIRTVPTIVVAGAGGELIRVWTALPARGEIEEAIARSLVPDPG